MSLISGALAILFCVCYFKSCRIYICKMFWLKENVWGQKGSASSKTNHRTPRVPEAHLSNMISGPFALSNGLLMYRAGPAFAGAPSGASSYHFHLLGSCTLPTALAPLKGVCLLQGMYAFLEAVPRRSRLREEDPCLAE